MNIRSIDLQVLIPKATEVSRIQHTENQLNAALQQDFASQWQRISQTRQQQVQTINQAEHEKVNEKHEREKRQQAKPKKYIREHGLSIHADEQTGQPVHADPTLGHTIDIKT